MNRAAFERHVSDALATIPKRFRDAMRNIAIVVEDEPSRTLLREREIEPPDTLFGLYQGVPLTERRWDYGNSLPDRIVLFQGPHEREAAGKPACGHIRLRAAQSSDAIAIEVHDDGRGIDWDGVRERAAANGFDVDSTEAMRASLFAGGVSTVREVTDLSGRGIGMSALFAAANDLGGRLDLESVAGKGTQIRLTIPTSNTARTDVQAVAA